jgi:16S rRNA U516 pseudouridylate synthase RsuA-like enzyme
LFDTLKIGVKTTDGVFPADLLSSEVLIEKVFVPIRTNVIQEDDLDISQKISPRDSNLLGSLKVCSKVKLSVCEGKYRMVRRILHNAGHSVVSLHREHYGGIALADLPTGSVRLANVEEENWAKMIAKSIKK